MQATFSIGFFLRFGNQAGFISEHFGEQQPHSWSLACGADTGEMSCAAAAVVDSESR